MAKQTFTAGQTLTAQQMSDLQANDYNLTVSTKTDDYTFVAGDKGTRVVANKASAIEFTVDDAVFTAGDTLQVSNINTGLLTLTAGSGLTLNGADVLTVAQWQGGTLYFTSASSAIWFPTAKTVTSGFSVVVPETALSSAASFTQDNVFTSSYTNYKLIINGTGASTATATLQLRVGGVTAATNYNRQLIDARSTTLSGSQATSQTSLNIGLFEVDFRNTIIIDIMQPAQAQFTNFYYKFLYTFGASTTDILWNSATGIHSAATAYDGLIVTFGSNTTGSYTLYGYGK